MKNYVWLGVVGALSLLITVNTGCEPECVDSYDCRSNGADFVCEEGVCVEGEPTPEEDAGVEEEDAGTEEEDAGTATDAGVTDAGVTDAGVTDGGVTDGGTGECTTANPTCEGPFACTFPADGGSGTCTPLWIGVTQSVDAGLAGTLGKATLVPFNATSAAAQVTLGEAASFSKLPRFSGDGTALVYVQRPALAGDALLKRRVIASGTETVLATSSDAGIEDFVQLEYAPSSSVLWTRFPTRSGIQWIPDTGAGRQELTLGGYGDWFPGGGAFAYDSTGIKVHVTTDGGNLDLTTNDLDTEPKVSPDGKWVLFLRAGTADYTDDLHVVSAAGGTPVAIATHQPATGTEADGGTVGHFASNHSWAGPSSAVYVRVNYFHRADGGSVICEPEESVCGAADGGTGGLNGQQIVFQAIDPTTGAATGDGVVSTTGIWPSVSPDGRWLAYIIRGQTGNSELRVVPITATGNVADAGFVHSFPALDTVGDDARPRWQSKP